MQEFIGRKDELKRLKNLYNTKGASFAVIKGRRRIGKSRLIRESIQDKACLKFIGLAPTKNTTAQMQKDEFLLQLSRQINLPPFSMNDWGNIFHYLAEHTKNKKVIIVLDEISWMGSEDPNFLSKLKTIWDEYFSTNPGLTLILCGSISSWIEENILASTGFLGRPTMVMTVEELPILDCLKFWGDSSRNLSAYEKLKVLAVTGGIPRYLELINPKISAEQIIHSWLFHKDGILLNEFKYIFSDIFARKSQSYAEIIRHLVQGALTQEEIREKLGLEKSGDLSEKLANLSLAGFIARDYTWSTTTAEIGKLSKYRLRDNYMRFYLKYIDRNRAKIEKGLFENTPLNKLKNWYSILGLQFENLIIQNRELLMKKLGFSQMNVIFDNPYFQRGTTKQRGCQIDYLIQTDFDCLFVIEIKFSKNPIGKSVVQAVKEKVDRLIKPKQVSIRPVLIHVNGVDDSVVDEDYFSDIIDFSELLS